MTTYTAISGNATNISTVTVSEHFTDPGVKVKDDAIDLFEAHLGTWNTSTDGLTVTGYIDDPNHGGAVLDQRTWYDGVGYELAPPEAAVRITSFTSVGGNLWELTLEGAADTGYEFYTARHEVL